MEFGTKVKVVSRQEELPVCLGLARNVSLLFIIAKSREPHIIEGWTYARPYLEAKGRRPPTCYVDEKLCHGARRGATPTRARGSIP